MGAEQKRQPADVLRDGFVRPIHMLTDNPLPPVAQARLAPVHIESVAATHDALGPIEERLFFTFDIKTLPQAEKVVYQSGPKEIVLSVPVGAYGEAWAQKLVVGANKLAIATLDHVTAKQQLQKLAQDEAELLDTYTFRQSDAQAKDLITGPEATVVDGIHTTAIALALLTAYIVPGYEANPEGLAKTIVENGLLSELALLINPKVPATMGMYGYIFNSSVLEVAPDGKIKLSQKLTDLLAAERRVLPDSETTGAQEAVSPRGCLAARRSQQFPTYDTSVNMTGKLLLQTMGIS